MNIHMKKSVVKKHAHVHTHQSRRIAIGIALVLLGVLTVINLLTMSHSYNVVPVQGADAYDTQ